jgi:hypothetical protein
VRPRYRNLIPRSRRQRVKTGKRLQALYLRIESASVWFLRGNWIWRIGTGLIFTNNLLHVIRPGMGDSVTA